VGAPEPPTAAPASLGEEASADDAGAQEVDALIAATWAVAARVGSIEPSVRDILIEAGLSTKAFYRHFRSKDDLLLETFREGTRILVEYLERRIAAHEEAVDRIGAWVHGYVRQAAPPAASRTLPWSLGIGRLALQFPDDFDRNQSAIVAPLQREIAAAVAEGSCHTPDPGGDAWLIFGYTVDTVRRHLLRDTTPDRATVDRLVGFALRALGRPAPADPGRR
jgi:AcrR family transcriptional regulator